MPPSAATPTTCSLPLSSLSLIVQRIKDHSLQARIVGLTGDDAQCIADFLSALLHEDGAFSLEDKRYLLATLRKLVKFAQVLPQSYKLQDLQCDFSQAREGGAFADIYQGVYQGQKICVKAVRIFQRGENARMLRAFAKEIVIWAHLSHENILPFYDGGDLSVYLQNFPDSPRLPLALDVTAGLRYLHQSNIVHGDLKAKNILVSDRGRALIADFGISCIAVSQKLISTQLSCGTMRWMAPELFTGDAEGDSLVTLQSDVWSLGCVYYEVLARKVPFYEHTNDARLSFIRHEDPKVAPLRPTTGDDTDNISDAMWDLMNKCWTYEPRLRPGCDEAYELITSLVKVRENQDSPYVILWKAIRGGPEIGVLCEQAHHILFQADYVPHSPISNGAIPSDARTSVPPNTVYRLGEVAQGYPPSVTDSTDSFHTARSAHGLVADSCESLFDEAQLAIQVNDRFEFSEDDMIIAIMGCTGVGKSTFIKIATGSEDIQIGHSLRTCTQHIRAIHCHSPLRNQRVVFVDTPGFNHETVSDMETLAKIAHWLEKTYEAGIKLSGILYLCRITGRITNTLIRNLDMFRNLCGNSALSNVRLVTTHWDQLKDNNEGIKIEEKLRKKYWNTFLSGGSQMLRFEYSCSSAWQIIDSLSVERKVMRIQMEMVDQCKLLGGTSAAMSLSSWVHLVGETSAAPALWSRVRTVGGLKNFIAQLQGLIKKHGKDSEKQRREEELKMARKLLDKLENDKSQFYSRPLDIYPNRSPKSRSICSTSTTSTWRSIAYKIFERREGTFRRQPRHTPIPSICSNPGFTVPNPSEGGRNVFYSPPDPGSTLESLSCTIQRLQAVRFKAPQQSIPGFEDAVEIVLRISEALNEMPGGQNSLPSLMDSTSWFLCTISDKYLPTGGYLNSVVECFGNIHRRLVHIQNIVTRLKDSGAESLMSLSPDDRHAISECREAVTSASRELQSKL